MIFSEIFTKGVNNHVDEAQHNLLCWALTIYQGWLNLLYVWAAYRKTQVTKSRNMKI